MKLKLLIALFAVSTVLIISGIDKVYAAETQSESSVNEIIDNELMLDYEQNCVTQTKLQIVLVMGVGILIGALCIYVFLSRLK